VLLAGALLCVGCFSLTSFQSPQALPPGSTSVGGGLAAYWWVNYGSPLPEADFLFRYGLFKSVDVGGKVSLPLASVSADAKWQFLNGPLLAALDVGGSYGRSPYMFDISEEADYLTAYPQLIVGSDRIHASARVPIVHHIGYKYNDWRPDTTTNWYPQVLVGGSFGDRLRVMPELSLTFGTGNRQSPRVLPGIGLAFRYGPGASTEQGLPWSPEP
jgi:hypothetical protein